VTLPLAHLGHYLWIFYLVPIVIVIAGIVASVVLGRRRERR
jgi:cytochrome c-type biogenesis protein CcmH/NrfF